MEYVSVWLENTFTFPNTFICKYTLQMSFLLQGVNSSPNLQTIPVLQPDFLQHKKAIKFWFSNRLAFEVETVRYVPWWYFFWFHIPAMWNTKKYT